MKSETIKEMKKKPAAISETPAPAEIPAIYEVTCHSVEIDGLICYRTHRLSLTQARAEEINTLQPETLRFVGV